MLKGSSNIKGLYSKVQKDLDKMKQRVYLEKVGTYLSQKVREEAADLLLHSPHGLPQSEEDIETLIKKIDYKIEMDVDGNKQLKIGIFGDQPAAQALESIEYGTTETMEIPIFRTVIPAQEPFICMEVKKNGGNKL